MNVVPLRNEGQRVYRIARTAALRYALGGGVLAMFGGLVVSRGDSVNPGLIGAVLGFVLGHVIGSRQRTTICSDPVCGALLQPGDARCARCGGKIAGELAHANDRLDAEER